LTNYLDLDINIAMKRLAFLGRSFSDLSNFPSGPRRKAGYQLRFVQSGMEPEDWKPMPSIGAGVREIRVRDDAGAFRIIYIASFAEAVFVLHAFQKKSQKTVTLDIELARTRYKLLLKEVGS
jgi:phage-related protein